MLPNLSGRLRLAYQQDQPGGPPAPPVDAPPAEVPSPPTPPEAPRTFDEDYVKKLRAEAADYRTKYQQEKVQGETRNKELARALGLEGPDDADPKKLAEQLAATQRNYRELQVSHSLLEAARKHGADTDLLVPYLRGSSSLDGLDPSSETFSKDVSALVKDLVDKNPKLKASQVPPRSGSEFPGGTQNTPQQLTREQVQRMYREGKHDEIDKARKAGQLDAMLRGGAGD